MRNPKFKYRNPKQIRMTECPKLEARIGARLADLPRFRFRISNFEFVSDFEIRASNFPLVSNFEFRASKFRGGGSVP